MRLSFLGRDVYFEHVRSYEIAYKERESEDWKTYSIAGETKVIIIIIITSWHTRAAAVNRNIAVTRGSELTVRFRFVFSRFRFGSGLYFF